MNRNRSGGGTVGVEVLAGGVGDTVAIGRRRLCTTELRERQEKGEWLKRRTRHENNKAVPLASILSTSLCHTQNDKFCDVAGVVTGRL